MTGVYNLLRETCGISQAEAAEHVHGTRLDTVKSWCSDRRPVPPGAIEELRALARDIQEAAETLADRLKRMSEANGGNIYTISTPKDETDARWSGFPSIGAQMRAIGIAISQLPDNAEILLVPHVPAIPTAVNKRKRAVAGRATR